MIMLDSGYGQPQGTALGGGGAPKGLALQKQEAETLITSGHLMWSANGADVWKSSLSTVIVQPEQHGELAAGGGRHMITSFPGWH